MKLKNALIFGGLLALASCSNDNSPNGPDNPNPNYIEPVKSNNCTVVYPTINISEMYQPADVYPTINVNNVLERTKGLKCEKYPNSITVPTLAGDSLLLNHTPKCESARYPLSVQPYDSVGRNDPNKNFYYVTVDFPPDLEACSQL